MCVDELFSVLAEYYWAGGRPSYNSKDILDSIGFYYYVWSLLALLFSKTGLHAFIYNIA
jgi:hypothetical protein